MFVFITTVRHPDNAVDFSKVTNLLNLTLRSVCNQKTDFEYKIIVVCNVKPKLAVENTHIEFLIVNFPIPGTGKASGLNFEHVLIDKGSKCAAGLLYAKKFNPTKIFFIDADDWISNDVVEFVSKNTAVKLWYVNRGYMVDLNNLVYVPKYGLCRYCGTSYIYDFEMLMSFLDLPNALKFDDDIESFLEHIDDFKLKYILGNHRHQFKAFQDFGVKLHSLPFNAICWILNTGENHSGKKVGDIGFDVDNNFLDKFGVSSLPLKNKTATLKSKLATCVATIQSYFGWLIADKKADRV